MTPPRTLSRRGPADAHQPLPRDFPAGNTFDKYRSGNPVHRWLMSGFLRDARELVDGLGAGRVLEVGCGPGDLAGALFGDRPDVDYTGVDISPEEVEKAARARPAYDFRVASAERLPFEDGSFDLVVACEVLEHLDDPAAALREMRRVCRGHLVASVPWEPVWRVLNVLRGAYVREWGNTPGHVQHFTRGAFRALVGRYFEPVDGRRPFPWTMLLARPKHARTSTGIDPGAPRVASRGPGWGNRVLYALTAVLSLAAMAWVVRSLVAHAGELRSVAGGRLLGAALAGAAAYAALTILLAVAWWWLLGAYQRRPPPLRAYAVWARTQIAKYLPGNVFHYAGRHALGRRIGLSHPTLIGASALETGGTWLAALAIAALGLVPSSSVWNRLPAVPAIVGLTLVLLLAWPVSERVLRRLPRSREALAELPPVSSVRWMQLALPAMAGHAAFLLSTGALMLMLLVVGWPGQTYEARTVVASYAAAWLIGTATPGAPGGLGVREAVLTAMLGPSLGLANAAALALALRGVTFLGDLITAGAGWLVRIDGRKG